MTNRIKRCLSAVLLCAGVWGTSALAWDSRDIVFECPCEASLVPAVEGGSGELTLTFGLRSYRATLSGEIRLVLAKNWEPETGRYGLSDLASWDPVGVVAPGAVLTEQQLTLTMDEPVVGTPIMILLFEQVADRPNQDKNSAWPAWHAHERLVLWPVPDQADSSRIQFLDILTDSDSDGVGDVNERLAGTAPDAAEDRPGTSTVDILTLYDDEVVQWHRGVPFTLFHHVMALANAIFADSGVDIRMRHVGASQIERLESGGPRNLPDNVDALMGRLGADMTFQFFVGSLTSTWPCPQAGGCSTVGGSVSRGHWSRGHPALSTGSSPSFGVHELGHAMGLAHSARQGETHGTFRWSRGYYLVGEAGYRGDQGTIMSYGPDNFGVFSDPEANCYGRPCGEHPGNPYDADAVTSLNLVRFQIASQRAAEPDSDGDGFVDTADALPDDPRDWADTDGDGQGDNADTDDDNDGVIDVEDTHPHDPAEWADADGDGLGDNADEDIADLSPFEDAALRAVVEKALGKSAGEAINEEEMSALTVLDGSFQGIRYLTGLELAANLEMLQLAGNDISDLRSLSNLTKLRTLDLNINDILDLSPLSELMGLESLSLWVNPVGDLSPLSRLTGLQTLVVGATTVTDLSPLSGLTGLRVLNAAHNGISDLSPLSVLDGLNTLSINNNDISDLTPLSEMRGLRSITLDGNSVGDLSALMGLKLSDLRVGGSDVTLEDVLALPYVNELGGLGLRGLGIGDISPLQDLTRMAFLDLAANSISDVSPLATLTDLLVLDLTLNNVSDIAPLVQRSTWSERDDKALRLRGNPLDPASIDEHIPVLRSWGIEVEFGEAMDDGITVVIPDPALNELVSRAVAGNNVLLDSPVTEESIARLRVLNALRAGVSDLTGLEAANNLQYLLLGANTVVDLTPIAELPRLVGLDLSDNLVSDISALVHNSGLGAGDWITLDGNPLNEEAVNTHIPALLRRGVEVGLESVRLAVVADGDMATYDTAGYFAAVLDGDLSIEAEVSAPLVAGASIVDGVLTVSPGAAGGRANVTLTATAGSGETASLTFEVTVRVVRAVSLFPGAEDPVRQGFVRTINHSARRGEVRIETIDDSGMAHGHVTLLLGAGEAVHFNSRDLESGNLAKGLRGAVGAGEGDWRLAMQSDPDLELLSYIRTTDGFLTAMHDVAPLDDAGHRVATFNPGSNRQQVSLLRLSNPTASSAMVKITGVDDEGQTPGGAVSLSLSAGASRTVSALQLESGEGIEGALGDGSGKWRLRVTSDQPVGVANLLQSPTGHLTNLSTVPDNKTLDRGVTTHHVPLFLSASDPKQRQGFLRVINRGANDAIVRIDARDDTDRDYDTVELEVGAGKVRHFNSHDLESGNAAKGLTAGVGSGEGDWRLELESGGDIDVLAYVRTRDGFLTSMHDTAPRTDDGYVVSIFNPAANQNQRSRLRLINSGPEAAQITVLGIDDRGASPGTPVRTRVPAGAAVSLTATQLEVGHDSLEGALGDGNGKWRLLISSDRAVTIMSLLESPTGHLTNLSTTPAQQ